MYKKILILLFICTALYAQVSPTEYFLPRYKVKMGTRDTSVVLWLNHSDSTFRLIRNYMTPKDTLTFNFGSSGSSGGGWTLSNTSPKKIYQDNGIKTHIRLNIGDTTQTSLFNIYGTSDFKGIPIFQDDTLKINGLFYDFPSIRFVGSVPYDSLGNGILTWRHSPAFIDKVNSWSGAQTFNGKVSFGASAEFILPTYNNHPSEGNFFLASGILKYSTGGNLKTVVSGSGTTNEIPYWSSANTIGTLPVATYPSLTELSYAKGVTSAIQTQLNAKQATLTTGNLTESVTGLQFDATRQVIGGAATLSLTSGYSIPADTSIANWRTAYASLNKFVTLTGNQSITGGKSFASYLSFTSTGYLSLPTLATTNKGDLHYKEDGTYTVGEYRGYNVNGAFSLIRDNATYSNPAWVASLSENKISFTDITTGNASTSNHGYLPKLNNSATQYLNGQGAWTTPTATVDQTAAYSWTGLHKFTSALLSSDTTGAYFNSYTATSGADIKGLTSYVYTSSNPTANKIYGGFFSALGSGTSGGTKSYGIYSVATGSNDNYAGYFNAPSGYASYFDNGLVYIKDNLQVGSAKFIVSTTGTITKVNDLLASDYANRFLMSDGTSYTPTDLFGRNNVWTGSFSTTPDNISWSGTISMTGKKFVTAGGSGNQTTTTLSDGVNGQEVILMNTSSSFTWTLNETGNINLAGSADYVMGQYDTITLIYYDSASKWIETSRSDN